MYVRLLKSVHLYLLFECAYANEFGVSTGRIPIPQTATPLACRVFVLLRLLLLIDDDDDDDQFDDHDDTYYYLGVSR